VVGDLATENDADRLGRSGPPARQIVTNTVCHLEAAMVQSTLEGWDLTGLDFLFIENVGDLVYLTTYDLGEHIHVVLFSATEGEDKPRKSPTIFKTADLPMITKMTWPSRSVLMPRRPTGQCRRFAQGWPCLRARRAAEPAWEPGSRSFTLDAQ